MQTLYCALYTYYLILRWYFEEHHNLHFANEEIDQEKLSDLLKVIQVIVVLRHRKLLNIVKLVNMLTQKGSNID